MATVKAMTITIDSLLPRPKLDYDVGYDATMKGASVVVSLCMKDGKKGNHHSITCVCGAVYPWLAYQLIRNSSSDRRLLIVSF